MMTFSMTMLGIMTLSRMTLCIITLSIIKINNRTLIIPILSLATAE